MNEYNDILYIPGQGGGYVPPSEVTAVELQCDVQDETGGLQIITDSTNTGTDEVNWMVYLKNENDVTRFDVDQNLMISRNGAEKVQVKVSNVIEMDGHLKVNVQ